MENKEVNTCNLFGNIRTFFFIRLLAGKKSVLINCKLINSEATVNGNCLLTNNQFEFGKNISNRLVGLTIKPRPDDMIKPKK